MGIGHWGLGTRKQADIQFPMPYAPCPIPYTNIRSFGNRTRKVKIIKHLYLSTLKIF
ncbi:MAG: hypothetical protein RMY29_025525 [Nostoc sp. CreGUA01]|nr:hypothetical protein [Nostoc sp. CreGUA01]